MKNIIGVVQGRLTHSEELMFFPFAGTTAKKSSEVLNQLIEQGSKIGVERILIPFLGNSEIKSQQEKEEIIKNLQPSLKKAEAFNMELSFETSLGAVELREFIEQFKHPLVKAYFDTGNRTTFVGNKVPEEIKELGALISGVHIKDRKFGATTSYPIGKGATPFPEIFKALKAINYNGPFISEAARDSSLDEVTLNTLYLNSIKEYIKSSYNE